jgi:hypothetical protein
MSRSLAAAAVVGALLVAGACGSGHRAPVVASGSGPSNPTTLPPKVGAQSPSTTVTTTAPHLPTVPNCGGGAFEPTRLLIVCGSATTMATGVTWRAWGSSQASGSGTVEMPINGQLASAPATLTLGDVVDGSVGPQFTLLTVTWTGTSPDGKRQDVYRLQVQG